MPLSHFSPTELLTLKSILDLTDQPILLYDAGERLVGASRLVASLFAEREGTLSLGEVLGSSYESFKEWLSLARQNKDASIIEFSSHSQLQDARHIAWKSQAIVSADARFIGFCLVGADYTVRDKLENDLKKSLRLIQDQKMAIDESSIVAITDKSGVIQYVNDTFCRVSGYDREDLIGKTHSVVKSSFHPPEFFKDIWSTISRGKVWKGEIKNKTKQGDYYWVDTTIIPFVNEAGRPYQYIAIRNDITEKKMYQEKLEQERVRAVYAEKMASLGELAAGIAHELGNPAASINAWLDVIEAQQERGELDLGFFTKMIPKVRKDAARIRDIIRGMLAYARDGSRDPFQLENPLLLVNQMVDSCAYKLRSTQVQIEVLAPNPYLSLECRVTEISQMLVIFILNACDAVAELPAKWIRIEILGHGDEVEFHIIDSGRGIPKDLYEQIFHPFFTTKPLGVGTGLGLSIAQSIVDNHRGRIRLNTESPHTEFVISLPMRQKSP